MSEIKRLTRNYEVSVWTLQDGFITVLGSSNAHYRGRILNPEMKLVNDGTLNFNFEIPMYLHNGEEKIVNPVWNDIYNTPSLVGMRKIKVIFNKGTDVEKVFEFLITKVTKIHEEDKPSCKIECEGLAFHELGKIGYKIEFSTDVVTLKNYEWYKSRPVYDIGVGKTYATPEEWLAADDLWAEQEPRVTIDYWMYLVIGIDPYPKIVTELPKSNELASEYLIWSNEDLAYEYKTWNTRLKSWQDSGLVFGPEDVINSSKWYYKVLMDWSAYSKVSDIPRESDKIYEEELVTNWNENLLPKNSTSVTSYKEKTRIMDEKESNIYNLTLKLAETFGVFCRYEYEYDDNYHIKSRTIVFYNSAVKDGNRKFSFTYPYSSTRILREDDSVDLVTKMYVSSIEDLSTESGLVTIMNSSANKTKEDYLLNFDYLYSIGTITDELYEAIKTYEKDIRAINDALEPLLDQLLVYLDRLPKAEAAYKIAHEAILIDAERINASTRLKEALDMSAADEWADGLIHVVGENARSVVLIEEDSSFYYFNVPEKGTDYNSIVMYKKLLEAIPAWLKNTTYTVGAKVYNNNITYKCKTAHTSGETFSDTNWTNLGTYYKVGQLYQDSNMSAHIGLAHYDSTTGDLIKVGRIPKSLFMDRQVIYITFNYSPKLYYEKIELIWRNRKNKDEADANRYETEVNELKDKIDKVNNGVYDNSTPPLLITPGINTLLDEKAELIKGFERLMGPALREGLWKPDNYDTTVGEKYTDLVTLTTSDTVINGTTDYMSFVWDTELFDDELEAIYRFGINATEIPYECLVLDNVLIAFIKLCMEDNKPVGLLYYDYKENITEPETNPKYRRCLAIGASAILTCIKYNNEYRLGLLLTGITEMSAAAINFLKDPQYGLPLIGYLDTPEDNEDPFAIVPVAASTAANTWVSGTAQIAYPRVRINSLSLKRGETDLMLAYNYSEIKEFEDYYVFLRVDLVNENKYESRYYITIKPEVFISAGTLTGPVGIRYALSNASTAIYVDAQDVIKENSKPKVTYSLDPNILLENFTYTAYQALNTIAFINDYELLFDGAQGYISEVNLNLDFPNEDKIEIKNYKNKFEDLFSTIVALTLAMEKNESIFAAVTKIVSSDGSISAPALEGALRKVDLNYSFNLGKLTINEKDGIWGTSDDGVVAFRGGGIFTATEKDESGSWLWNTGIVPQGINANLITSGLLDTNKIKVYSGNDIRFLLNGDGLFAYKAFFSDWDILSTVTNDADYAEYLRKKNDDANFAQYVTLNKEGLFLSTRKDSYVVNKNRTDYFLVGYKQDGNGVWVAISNFPKVLNRVEISWDGLILRNWYNEKVFYADPDTGNLTVTGTIKATGLYIMQNNTMLEVLFSVDPTSHHIKLSSTNFDSDGIKSSVVEIVPSGITIKSGGTLNLSGASVTLSANLILGMPNMNNYYAKQGKVSIHSEGVDITGGRVNIDASSGSSYVHISTSLIDIKSGKITINNLPIWERNDIMYSAAPPTSGYPTDRAWLWALPWGYNSITYSLGANNTLVSDGRVLNSSSNMKFTLKMTFYLSGVNVAVNNIAITCSVSGGISLSKTHTGVNFPAGSGNGISGSVEVTSEWLFTDPTKNLCNTSVLYYSFSGTSSYPMGLSTASLSATSADPNGSWRECKIYYFPKGTHP